LIDVLRGTAIALLTLLVHRYQTCCRVTSTDTNGTR
jgi:hypothetical protein